MNRIKLIWILVIVLIIPFCHLDAQHKDTLYYNVEWKGVSTIEEAEYYRILTFNLKGRPTGEILDYYKTGELQGRIEEAYSVDRFDDSKSLFIGKAISYSPNGNTIGSWTYNSKSAIVGNAFSYYESGAIQSILPYDSLGLLSGTVMEYYESGKVACEIEYTSNEIDGICKFYRESGTLSEELIYKDGDPVSDWYLFYTEQGKAIKYDFNTKKPYKDEQVLNKGYEQIKELKSYYKEGRKYKYYVHNGISITMSLSIVRNYGKYYVANIAIENLTGRAFNFNPNSISATLTKNRKEFQTVTLSSSDYSRIVKNRQAWDAAFIAMGEYSAANQAGKSSSSTNSTTSGYYNSSVNVSGDFNNNYVNLYGNSTTYGSSTTQSNTQSYSGAANYAAQQNAQKKVANYQNQQYQIRDQLSQGYLKRHTIENEQRIVGQINLKYKKAETIIIRVLVNGIDYDFLWTINYK